jgi:hypothetical protein
VGRSLVEDIAKILGALERVLREEGRLDVADLILEAKPGFEETSYDNWNGGTYGYTLQLEVPARSYAKLGDTVDNLEKDLKARIERFTRLYSNEHVEGVVIAPSLEEPGHLATRPTTVDVPAFWKQGTLRLFLSHVSTVKKDASALAGNLLSYGVSGFVAHEDIEPTKEWEDEIRLALSTCDALVCLLTNDFNQSKWTDQEVGFAIGRGILVIPIRMGLDPYGFMARYQGYAAFDKPSHVIAEVLVGILAKHPSTRGRTAEALVHSFEKSESYADAKANAKRLSLVDAWSSDLAQRVRRALKENDQVADAYGVPELIGRLLSEKGLP